MTAAAAALAIGYFKANSYTQYTPATLEALLKSTAEVNNNEKSLNFAQAVKNIVYPPPTGTGEDTSSPDPDIPSCQ